MRVRCPACNFPVRMPLMNPDAMTPFEQHVTAQINELGGLAIRIYERLGWIVFLLALLVGGCALNTVNSMIPGHREVRVISR